MAKRRGAGRPEHVPTEKLRTTIRDLAIGGATQDQVSELLNLDRKTLRKYYGDIFKNAKLLNNGKVIGKALDMALSGLCPAMTIFYLKTQCGWKEKVPEHNPERQVTVNIGIKRGETRPSELKRRAEYEALNKQKTGNE